MTALKFCPKKESVINSECTEDWQEVGFTPCQKTELAILGIKFKLWLGLNSSDLLYFDAHGTRDGRILLGQYDLPPFGEGDIESLYLRSDDIEITKSHMLTILHCCNQFGVSDYDAARAGGWQQYFKSTAIQGWHGTVYLAGSTMYYEKLFWHMIRGKRCQQAHDAALDGTVEDYLEDQKELPCIREGEKRNYWPYMLGNINLTSCN